MCFDQTSFNDDFNCGGTHCINDIYMKIQNTTDLEKYVDEIDELP
jgi:hypothetical protein